MANLTVGPSSSYPTVAAAMLVAIPGDIISLEVGYGDENATVTVDGLTFDGDSSSININLQLGSGISTVTLLGVAPINILDSADNNSIVGNDADNIISVSSGMDVVTAGNGTDRLIVDYASATADITGTFVDVTDGGTHTVTFTGVENFTITTGSGSDMITVGDGDNVVSTGDNIDNITAGNGPNLLDGGAGRDTITAGSGVNIIYGGAGNDIIIAGDGGNTVDGGDGDDDIQTGIGNDVVTAGLGNNTIATSAGADVITVNGGIDTVDAGSESDRLIIDFSNSTAAVIGGVTGGTLAGGYDGRFDDAGASSVVFQATENFTVTTGSGNDYIGTGDGDDVLDGGAGSDELRSGGGNDAILIGLGSDMLDGGAGTDSAIFSGARSDYQVSDLGGGIIQAIDLRNGSPDGTDTMVNFEGFVFTNGTFDAVTVLAGAPATLVTSLTFSADTGASNSDFITNTAAQTISGELGANLVTGDWVEVSLNNGSTWTTASSSVGSNTFSLSGQTLAGSNVLMVRVSNLAGDGTAASEAYVLDSSAPALHLNGITAVSQSTNNTPGSTVHFTLAFDEAVDVTGGTPTLTLNDGASAVYNAAATAALHDATRLAFDYLVSSSDTPTQSLAVTGFSSNGAAVDDIAGNHATLNNVTAVFAALSVNQPEGTIVPAYTINGFTRPALYLDAAGHIILDEATSNWAATYGTKALYFGMPESTPFPPVADAQHLHDGLLM